MYVFDNSALYIHIIDMYNRYSSDIHCLQQINSLFIDICRSIQTSQLETNSDSLWCTAHIRPMDVPPL